MSEILIVDDELSIRMAMENILTAYGQCTLVAGGLEAINVFKQAIEAGKPFNVIMLDISLEDKSGLEILKEIRNFEKENEVAKKNPAKIVMVTSNGQLNIVKACIAYGCNDFLVKPVKPEILSGKLTALGISRVASEDSKE